MFTPDSNRKVGCSREPYEDSVGVDRGPPATVCASDERQNQDHSCDETANVRPECNATRRSLCESGDAVQELLDEPPANNKDRQDVEGPKDNEQRNQDADARPWIEQ